MKQKISSRILIVLISVVMLIAALPLNSLIAFAEDYSGTGGANSPVSGYSDSRLTMGGNEYGVRIYCITKNSSGNYVIKANEKNPNGIKAVDLWKDQDAINEIASDDYSGTCRFGSINVDNDIHIDTFDNGVALANASLAKRNILKAGASISDIPKFAGFAVIDGRTSFFMNGGGKDANSFKSWATKDVAWANGKNAWQVVSLFYGLTGISLTPETDYLVVEPIMHLPIVTGQWTDSLEYLRYQGHTACTWHTYLKQLGDNSGGTMMDVKANWGEGFKLSHDKAGLIAPGRYIRSMYIGKTHDQIGKKGWGIHIMNINDDIGDTPEPVDSYDIVDNPTTPDNAETPTDKNKNKGDITIGSMSIK